jgi:large subunit ribosomal protein L23
MAKLQYYDVLLKPLMTEKSMRYMEAGSDAKDQGNAPVYSFYVHPEATKTQVKDAVEKLFNGTKVASVNTLNCHPKKTPAQGFCPRCDGKAQKGHRNPGTR